MALPASIQFRKHTRLGGLDYRESLAYFVTICTRDRAMAFGSIADGTIRLSRRGVVARDCWLDIPNHHPHVELDALVVMPNHVHGILLFVGDPPGISVEATPASRRLRAAGPLAGSIGAVVGSYKSAVARAINRLRPGAGSGIWQTNYYEHVIRSDRALDRIRDYIETNPSRWMHDVENPEGDGRDDVMDFVKDLRNERGLRPGRDAGVAPTGGRDARVARAAGRNADVTSAKREGV